MNGPGAQQAGSANSAPAARVVVCGAGLAGFSAAVTALEQGAAVTLIEKAPEIGGTTVLSGGLVWTFADYEEARAKIPAGDAALQWLVCDGIEAGRAWLAGMGARFAPVEPVLGHGSGQKADPAQLIAVLADRFAALGGELRLATAFESLTGTDGVVTGVRALVDGRIVVFPAGAVVLATGGFQGNTELLARHVVRDPNNLALRASYWSTGDAFVAATRFGAAASPGLGTFYGHALVAAPARYSRFQLREASQYHGILAVALNLAGHRFADETAGSHEEALNQHLAQQPGGRGVYIVDDSSMERPPVEGREATPRTILARARSLGAFVSEAPTLDALCRSFAPLGIPAEVALQSLQAFNAAMQDGAADRIHPARARLREPLVTPPFRAVAVQAGITFTMGGLAIDERARVLWRAGGTSPYAPVPVERAYADLDGPVITLGNDYRQTPIHGLYAAGNDAGNISHFGYMGGLASALVTGQAAGRDAARVVTLRANGQVA